LNVIIDKLGRDDGIGINPEEPIPAGSKPFVAGNTITIKFTGLNGIPGLIELMP
jgi:hypothetical protein